MVFISFSCLLLLGLPILCWIKATGVGILVWFLILEEKLQLFTIESDVSCRFIIYGLYYVKVCSLYIHFDSFLKSWMLNFVKCFFCIYWNDHMIFILQFINMVYHIGWMLNHPYIPGTNSTWSWYMILLIYCWIQFADILLSSFASRFIRDIGE